MLAQESYLKTRISEIFSSLQGEGVYVGQRHLFIRFEGCHLDCVYCDEKNKKGREWTLQEVLEEVERLESASGPHAYVSLTGGEPLCELEFLKRLIPELKERGHKIYLETNGVLWQALAQIIQDCDCIAMDMKLSCVSGTEDWMVEHKRFLEVARAKNVLIKLAISRDLQFENYERLIRMIAVAEIQVPVILQPVSTSGSEGHEDPELMSMLQSLQSFGAKWIRDIRVVPRLHRILKIR
ncbi:MAG: 7-carboxy-7-deazaguanine synthase QueE [Candidatus Omnitrophica bacterium]|nr:7-carboxy-7-deazaguanine synthase QueE [Candidatus Omnitrophota bacterium]